MDIAKTVVIEPGRYVVAVSGGVDSVALLHILSKLGQRAKVKGQSKNNTQPSVLSPQPYSFTVAHYDHGIRADSAEDRRLVQKLAEEYGLPFVYEQGNLGENASEALAREKRYEFLRKVAKEVEAHRIITAHHLDDVLETATHNVLRGTGRKGMSSLKSVDGIQRPLLHIPKAHLRAYAQANGLKWREDSTNQNLKYKRNYIRNEVLAKLKLKSPENYRRLQHMVKRQQVLNQAIDDELLTILHQQPKVNVLLRYDVIRLPHKVAKELVGEWLRNNGKRQFGSKQLEQVVLAAKTALPRTRLELDNTQSVEFDNKYAKFVV